MKKLLLGLGTVSLAILPVAAMVSCSTTPTLDTEATKFTVSLEAKTPATTTTAAVDSITGGDASAKLTALKTLVGEDKLPTIAEGFTFEVKSAMINKTLNTTVDVKIMITETESTETVKTKEATLSITKLTPAEPTLDTEAAKFGSVATKTPSTTQAVAIATITDAANAGAKLDALKVLADVPALADGFTFEVTTAAISGTTDMAVSITITKTAGSTTKDVTFTVTGLTAEAPSDTLETEAAKFGSVATKTPSTTQAAAIATITGAADASAKLIALQVLADVPTPAAGFAFEVTTAAASGTTDMTVSITITETDGTEGSNTKDVTFTVTGLTAE